MHIWYSHTLSLFQTNIKPLNPSEANPKQFVETVFPPFCFAPPIFLDIFISADIPLFPKRRHIYTRTAPNLFLTKTTKLTSHGTSRYPASSSYPIRSPTATLYQKKPTRVLEDFGSFVFSQETWDRRFIVSRSSSSLWVRLARKFVNFVKGVCSRS